MSADDSAIPKLILPVGTQVVARSEVRAGDGHLIAPCGAVGVIVKAPVDATHSYRVRFLNDEEASLRREDLTIRKRRQAEDLRQASESLDGIVWDDFVIYRCIVGSRAYGLDGPDSDVDRRGIYLPPASLSWSLYGVPEQLENRDREECYWELRKFLVLALKANPNILECLYTPLVESATPLAEELLAMRGCFLSQLVYQTYNGYVMSQFKKLEQDLRNTGAIKWKHAMHLIRLLRSGVKTLQEGAVRVRVEAERDLLLAIRRGDLSWDEVNRLRLSLHADFDAALAATALPERPDYARADAFLIRARREMAAREGKA